MRNLTHIETLPSTCTSAHTSTGESIYSLPTCGKRDWVEVPLLARAPGAGPSAGSGDGRPVRGSASSSTQARGRSNASCRRRQGDHVDRTKTRNCGLESFLIASLQSVSVEDIRRAMPRNPLVGGIFTAGGGGAALRPQLLLVRKTKLLQAPRRESPFGMWIPARLLLPEFVLAERCFLPIRAAFINTDALLGHGNASCTSPGARRARMGCLGKDVPHSILLRKTTQTNNGQRVRSFTGPCCGGARTAAAVSEPLGVEPPPRTSSTTPEA